MTKQRVRRDFLRLVGTGTVVTLAGCIGNQNTSTEPNNTTPEQNQPERKNENTEDDYTTFEELYAEAERKRPSSRHASPIDFDEIEIMLRPNNTEAENAAIAATQASLHEVGATPDTEDKNPEAIRYALDELDLNAYADNRTAYSGGDVTITEIYAENDDGTVQKVMVTNVPSNTDTPLGYSLIAGEEPQDEGPVSDNNLQTMWGEDALATAAALDFRFLENAIEHSGEDHVNWEKFIEDIGDYILDGKVSGSNIDFTMDAGQYMADLEDIDNDYHDEAYEEWVDTQEFYHNEVVPEDKHLLIEMDGGELNRRAVDEETLEENGFIYSNL